MWSLWNNNEYNFSFQQSFKNFQMTNKEKVQWWSVHNNLKTSKSPVFKTTISSFVLMSADHWKTSADVSRIWTQDCLFVQAVNMFFPMSVHRICAQMDYMWGENQTRKVFKIWCQGFLSCIFCCCCEFRFWPLSHFQFSFDGFSLVFTNTV